MNIEYCILTVESLMVERLRVERLVAGGDSLVLI